MSATIKYKGIEAAYDGEKWVSSEIDLENELNRITDHDLSGRERSYEPNGIDSIALDMVYYMGECAEIISLDETTESQFDQYGNEIIY